MDGEMPLRYGCNPHQIPAKMYSKAERLPFKVINGKLGYINALDALNSWQLVKELRQAIHLPAAASFKHVSPTGAAVGNPLSVELRKAYRVEDIELTPLASAYARARGTDRLCSFGDWIALSDPVDVSTAQLIQREVSDGVIAPGYENDAVAILQRKKGGSFIIVDMDNDYEPPEMETREIYGIVLEQMRNNKSYTNMDLENVVTRNKEFPSIARQNALISILTLKYTQSNSVCLAVDGQTIGVGAGQQSRIHCVRLASQKAENWFLRQHHKALDLKFRPGLHRPDKDNAVDLFLRDDLSDIENRNWEEYFESKPARMAKEEKQIWINNLEGIVLGSDGYFPFRDSIDHAQKSGVKYVVQPGGSNRDDDVIQACNDYDLVMAFLGSRLFHH